MLSILHNLGNISPANKHGDTPLHDAASNGHFEVFKLIFENMDEKNPKNRGDTTPFHNAAWHGYLNICEFIVKEIDDDSILNDQSGTGTPLGLAASKGHFEVCKFIIERVDDKNIKKIFKHPVFTQFSTKIVIFEFILKKHPLYTDCLNHLMGLREFIIL